MLQKWFETCSVLKCVVFIEGESLCIDGDVDGAVDSWLNYLQKVPGILMHSSRHTAFLFPFMDVHKLVFKI